MLYPIIIPVNHDIYQSLRRGEIGSLPLPDRALWRLSGSDRVRYLNGQVTNDVARLKEGETLYAAVCTAKGRMTGDIFVGASTDALWIDADISLRESLGVRLEKYIIADDAVLEDVSDHWRVSHVFGSRKPEAKSGRFVSSNRRSGLAGFDVWQEGREFFHAGLAVPAEIAETLRLEHGLPRWGAEMTEETLPPEAGMDRNGISYTKGCYVGQETIARIKSIGHVNKQLVVLESSDKIAPERGAELCVDDKVVGKITSSGFSPALEKGIALGYVQRQHAGDGQSFQCAGQILKMIEPPLSLPLT